MVPLQRSGQLEPLADSGQDAVRLRGISDDRHIDLFQLHDRNAFQHVVCAVALHGSAVAVGVLDLLDDVQLTCFKIVIGLYVSKTVDAADDLCRVFAKAVQDDMKRLFAGLVCSAGNADSAFGGGKAFVPCKERKALRAA